METDTSPWNPLPVDEGATVYHYTSATGLTGIMNDRALWASEATSLNDLSEISAGFAFIHARLKAATPHDVGGDGELLETLREYAEAGTVPRVSGLRTHDPLFVLCASLQPDDAAQWRLYTGQHSGYALHVDTGYPLVAVAPSGAPGAVSRTSVTWGRRTEMEPWRKVAYTDDDKTALVADLLSWATARAAGALLGAGQVRDDPDFDDADTHASAKLQDATLDAERDYRRALLLAAALMKPEGFIAEQEVRLIVTPMSAESVTQFRSTADLPVRYVRVAGRPADHGSLFAVDDRPDPKTGKPARTLPVTGVTVGPTPYYGHIANTVADLCMSAGIASPDVRESKVPLRW